MAETNKENELQVFKAFVEKVEQCNFKNMNCVTLKIWYNPDGSMDPANAMYKYMFWQIDNVKTCDFLAELEKKMRLGDWRDYLITTPNTELGDNEDFYGAVLEHVQEADTTYDPVLIEIRDK
ncbi:unnamed protein product [Mucor hiemalis]